ncbi:hypothetical protein IPL68_04985 [Candidatus Saccharibacteria bacterium]|nr:MAG: hypothetical protein IPL68_04985 [Candidatus Saccharibacteria bacterium]
MAVRSPNEPGAWGFAVVSEGKPVVLGANQAGSDYQYLHGGLRDTIGVKATPVVSLARYIPIVNSG